MPGAVQDVITDANFGEDWLRDFGMAKGRILAFSIDLLRRLYNTLALPCECVISYQQSLSRDLYCYAELAVSSSAVAETIASIYSLHLPTEGWPD